MKTFTVTWTIDIEAETAREAAEQALAIQRDVTSTATVFQVDEQVSGKLVIKPSVVDLSQEGWNMGRMKDLDYAYLMRNEEEFERQERDREAQERAREQAAERLLRQQTKAPAKKMRRYV